MLEKQQALIKHLGLNLEDDKPIYQEAYNRFEYGNEEYLVCTDEEADEEAKDYIRQSVWAFNSGFLQCHTDIDSEILEAVQDKCEGANEMIYNSIKDFDHFVSDAISSDGRGHFMSSYDGYEHEETINDTTYYIYRTN